LICLSVISTAWYLGVVLQRDGAVSARETWNASAAAHHLDARQNWWLEWPKAQRDHETACISCHTSLPYALSRSSMRHTLGETGLSAPEQTMLKYVEKRVGDWDNMAPFYNEKSGPTKSVESKGTEPVLNTLILIHYDAEQHAFRDITQKAFSEMWSAQIKDGEEAGSWNWLNFHNAPWESNESHYYGAALGAVAIGLAPADYKNSPGIQSNLAALRSYLTEHYEAQPLVNRIVILWASTRFPNLLTKPQQDALLTEIQAHQEADGGWSMATLGPWKRRDDTPIDPRSDGYATGLVLYALTEARVSQKLPEMKRGVDWLLKNQSPTDGLWPAYSLNKQRDPASDAAQFMSDAATGYSVMALEAMRR